MRESQNLPRLRQILISTEKPRGAEKIIGMKQFSTHNAFLPGNSAGAWLYDPVLQKLLAVLAENGEEARVVGGAVRDTLLGRKVADIDIAVTILPDEVMLRARQNGFHTVPLGVEFGTVIVLFGKRSFHITSLRADIATDGRRAKVRFCRDWRQDAARRDFTVNALYLDREGRLYDYHNGAGDLENGLIRFIGAAEARIKEDYLRILRFFRFYALLGRGRPDREALKAAAALKSGLEKLSAERVWDEFKKLLALPKPYQSLLWLRAGGILNLILPESAKWGIDALPGLEALEERGQAADALLRLMALIPPRVEAVQALAKRLRLAGHEKRRLMAWAELPPIAANISETELKKRIYFAACNSRGKVPPQAVQDALRIARATALSYGKAADSRKYRQLLRLTETWPAPQFPLSGHDAAAAGLRGAAIGQVLKKLEAEWVESGFALSKQALLEKLKM